LPPSSLPAVAEHGLAVEGALGLLVNVEHRHLLGLVRIRHWVVVKRLCGRFFLLDSSEGVAQELRDSSALVAYLLDSLKSKGQVLLVRE